MSLLDGFLRVSVGPEMAVVVSDILDEYGGVEGLVRQFEGNGNGPIIKSWVGTGSHLPISADQVNQIVGSRLMQAASAKAGLSTQDLASILSTILPIAINDLTPYGKAAGGPVC